MIERYSFSDVEKWTSGDQKITIDLKVNGDGKKLKFETNLVQELYFFKFNFFSHIFYTEANIKKKLIGLVLYCLIFRIQLIYMKF